MLNEGGPDHRNSRLWQHERETHVREAQDQKLQGGRQTQKSQRRGINEKGFTVYTGLSRKRLCTSSLSFLIANSLVHESYGRKSVCFWQH